MINHKFISFSAVEIYDLSYIHLHNHTIWISDFPITCKEDFSMIRASTEHVHVIIIMVNLLD